MCGLQGVNTELLAAVAADPPSLPPSPVTRGTSVRPPLSSVETENVAGSERTTQLCLLSSLDRSLPGLYILWSHGSCYATAVEGRRTDEHERTNMDFFRMLRA